MQAPKLPPQVSRLILLTAIIVVTYAGARALLRPSSYGEYGHYRGAALEEIASHKPTYAGMKACAECHGDRIAQLSKFEHRTIACEACHGAARAHAADPDLKTAKLNDSLCLRCHEANPAKPAFLRQIAPKDHFKGDRCIECHLPHQPKELP